MNLAQTDTRINDRLSLHLAGILFFIEERGVMRRKRGNGLNGPAPFTPAHKYITTPFLFACALVFVRRPARSVAALANLRCLIASG